MNKLKIVKYIKIITLIIILLTVFTVGAYFISDWVYADTNPSKEGYIKWFVGCVIIIVGCILSLSIWALSSHPDE